MKKTDRHEEIVRLVDERGAVSISELALEFGVAEITVRRDLKDLVQMRRLKQMQSVAVSSDVGAARKRSSREHYELSTEASHNAEAKERIGRYAASLIQDGDIVILDTGSTVEYLARSLRQDLDATFICFGLNVMSLIGQNPKWELIAPGGVFYRNAHTFAGLKSAEYLQTIRADKAFISASGVSHSLGVTSNNLYEVSQKQAALSSSKSRILIVDHSKFGAVKVAHFGSLSDFDTLVTDDATPAEEVTAMRDMGIEVVLV